MKKLLNTLYVMSSDSYLALDGQNVVVEGADRELGRVPLHNFESIVSMGYRGASPALMAACAEHGISLVFLSPTGKFLARVGGPQRGNVLLRKRQFSVAEGKGESLLIARAFIIGKLFNSRWVLERSIRDHGERIHVDKVRGASMYLQKQMVEARKCSDIKTLRGIEGAAAKQYYSVFDEMILQQEEYFHFTGRHRRPATDPVNALLSFSYVLLASMCASALEAVGLDPYVGFMHVDRPGRKSLALDLVEELRSVYADRFALHLINNRLVSEKDFMEQENGVVLLTDNGRKIFFDEWQKRKRKEIRHPFLEEKVEWGMVPYVQALLLARFLRGDLDGYPPFMWK